MVAFATQVKRRRGTTAQNDEFTGAEGEIVVDTERHELRVHDGVTQGGFRIGGGSSLVIGQILEVVGTADYTPEGCLLADGAEYTKTQFPDLWADFLTGTPKLQTCTYTEYANQIAEYGFCNKFAVDTTNETFKVPTRNKYRKLVKKIVNSDSWANIYDDGWVEQGGTMTFPAAGTSMATKTITFPIEMADTKYTAQPTPIWAQPDKYYGWALQTKTKTSMTYNGYNTTATQNLSWQVSGYTTIPDSTSNITREFVVVANGTLNQEQMDWSAWASSLAGKANIDLSNTPANVDYVVESQEPTSANGYIWYRKYKSGWVEQGGRCTVPATNGLSSSSVTVTLPVPIATPEQATLSYNGMNSTGYYANCEDQATVTTTTVSIGRWNNGNSVAEARYYNWTLSGMSAQ